MMFIKNHMTGVLKYLSKLGDPNTALRYWQKNKYFFQSGKKKGLFKLIKVNMQLHITNVFAISINW